MGRWSVAFAVKLGIIRLVLFKNAVDGSQQHSCNSNNGLFVTTALFQRKVTASNFGAFLVTNGAKSTLN